MEVVGALQRLLGYAIAGDGSCSRLRACDSLTVNQFTPALSGLVCNTSIAADYFTVPRHSWRSEFLMLHPVVATQPVSNLNGKQVQKNDIATA